jgi:integrase
MIKITKRVVDALAADPAGRDRFVWDAGDGALKGFGIRVKPSGIASFIIQYRTPEGRTRRLAIGRVGTLTPEDARNQAREKLAAVAKGADPSAERRRMRNGITVAELCDLYLAENQIRIKASTLKMDRSRIETHVKPLLGRQPVISLSSDDIERMQLDIATGKTAKPRRKGGRGGVARGGRAVAGRTVGMFASILEFARRKKLIAVNPARDVRRLPEGKQQRFLNLDEIRSLGLGLRVEEGTQTSPVALAAIRFLLLSGLRRMEALALPRASVDRHYQCIRFKDTKSGPQIRPVGSAALRLLDRLSFREESPWVFPANDGEGHYAGLPKVLGRVCARVGLAGVTIHVLRHSFAAAAAQLGYSELTIAGLLGHTVSGVTARYAHVPDHALVAAADRVSETISEALDDRRGGSQRTAPASAAINPSH